MTRLSDSDTIQTLTNTLTNLSSLPFISLRIWYEEGQLKYFLSNLPPRHTRKPIQEAATVPGTEKRVNVPPPEPSPVKTRGRGRKRPCVNSSTPDGQSAPDPPDQMRRGSSTSTAILQVSEMEGSRESVCEDSIISVSIPCANTFEVLSTLGDIDQEAAEIQESEEKSDTPPCCPRCIQSLRSISAFPDIQISRYPPNRNGIKAYSCGHREFENETYVCDDCRMVMCEICLKDESFRSSVIIGLNDKILQDLKN